MTRRKPGKRALVFVLVTVLLDTMVVGQSTLPRVVIPRLGETRTALIGLFSKIFLHFRNSCFTFYYCQGKLIAAA